MINIRIETERLIIDTVTEGDCNASYLSWLQDPEVNQFLESGFHQHTIEGIKQFVKDQANAVFVAVRIKGNNKHIGNIKIAKIHSIHKTAEYGIMMGDKSEWGKGYAKEATIAVLNYCFNTLNLRKICLGVIDLNSHAHSLYKRLGFKEEGVFKENFFYYPNSNFRDEIRMALFKKDWPINNELK